MAVWGLQSTGGSALALPGRPAAGSQDAWRRACFWGLGWALTADTLLLAPAGALLAPHWLSLKMGGAVLGEERG